MQRRALQVRAQKSSPWSGGGGEKRSKSNSDGFKGRSSKPSIGKPVIGGNSAGLAKRLAAQRPPERYITEPIAVRPIEEISRSELCPAPRWDTFCNHAAGEWVGHYGAFTPWEGKNEAVWLDENGRYVNSVFCRCVEQRVESAASEEEAARDQLVRKLARATKAEALPGLTIPCEGMDLPDDSGIDLEGFSYNADGVVVFDGGHYSAGPEFIGPQELKLVDLEGMSADNGAAGASGAATNGTASDAGSSSQQGSVQGSSSQDGGEEGVTSVAAASSTVIMEQSLVDWGSRMRLRAKITLRIGHVPEDDPGGSVAGEVDVEVLRILLFEEHWVGAASPKMQVPLAKLPFLWQGGVRELARTQPPVLSGEWKVWTMSAVAVDEDDPVTGEEGTAWVYSSNEEVQEWEAAAAAPSGESGGALWLPGGIVLSLKMLDTYSLLADDATPVSASSPASHAVPRSFCLSMLWQQGEAAGASGARVLGVEREYDGFGFLREVRHLSGVKGGWSGGSM